MKHGTDPIGDTPQALAIGEVAPVELHAPSLQLVAAARGPHEAADGVPAFEQTRDQRGGDVAAGAGDEDVHIGSRYTDMA